MQKETLLSILLSKDENEIYQHNQSHSRIEKNPYSYIDYFYYFLIIKQNISSNRERNLTFESIGQ